MNHLTDTIIGAVLGIVIGSALAHIEQAPSPIPERQGDPSTLPDEAAREDAPEADAPMSDATAEAHDAVDPEAVSLFSKAREKDRESAEHFWDGYTAEEKAEAMRQNEENLQFWKGAFPTQLGPGVTRRETWDTSEAANKKASVQGSSDYTDPCRQLKDFRTAVAGNAMGWFCERYGYGELELQVASRPDSSQLLLYRAVAKAMMGLEPLPEAVSFETHPAPPSPPVPALPAPTPMSSLGPSQPSSLSQYPPRLMQCGPNGCGPAGYPGFPRRRLFGGGFFRRR